eukprot:4309893-Ditylum_brightwellii.AAC.1
MQESKDDVTTDDDMEEKEINVASCCSYSLYSKRSLGNLSEKLEELNFGINKCFDYAAEMLKNLYDAGSDNEEAPLKHLKQLNVLMRGWRCHNILSKGEYLSTNDQMSLS